jgi:putative NADH-flavin reductase
MKLLLLGATGRTGRPFLQQAIDRGHHVTAFVQSASSMKPAPNVTIVVGNVRSAHDLAAALPGHDAVVSTLGIRSKADGMLLRDSAAAMLTALCASDVSRYIVVSQGLLFPSRSPIVALLRRLFAAAIADSTAMEHVVRASACAWTIVRPPRLTEGGASRGYRALVDALPRGAWSMARADLAAFLLDEAENAMYSRAIVGVG